MSEPNPEKTALRVIRLQAENIKKIVAVDITPEGDIVKITGANGSGKTSTLDALLWAIGGERGIQERPIRDGESKARVRVDLGDIVVERRFTGKGSSLVVANKEGARFTSPQAMLDSLIGRLSFDPMAFMRMDRRSQYNALREGVEIDGDIDALDAERLERYEERTATNRAGKELAAQIAAVQVPDDAPAEIVSPGDLVRHINEAMTANRTNDEERGRAAALQREAKEARARVVRLEAELKAALAVVEGIERRASAMSEEAASLQDTDVSALQKELEEIEVRNTAARKRVERNAMETRLDALREKSRRLGERIEAIDTEKARLLVGAKFPVSGLGFADGVVLFDGLPLDQASSAQQLRVSLGMAMAANPKLRVIRITDGSLLDSESMRIIEGMAGDHEYQIWIEQVDESGKVGVFIRDGHVVSVDGVSVATPGEAGDAAPAPEE